MPSTNPPIPMPSSVPAEISGRRVMWPGAADSLAIVASRFWARRSPPARRAEVDERHDPQHHGKREHGREDVPPEVPVDNPRPHLIAGAAVADGTRRRLTRG